MTAREHQPATRPGVGEDEWDIERLDVRSHLERIGYHGEPTVSVETLRALHRAHVTAIPFENLDIVLGRPIALELDAVADKLLRRSRGGYCFEHSLLFAALLERLGFPLTRLIARVGPEGTRPGPRSHMMLRVEVGGAAWLADVGFGAGFLEPIPLHHDAIVQQGEWRYRVARRASHEWTLSSWQRDGWSAMYAFTLEPQHHIDYEVANHFTATHPDSPFVGQPVVLGPGAGQRLGLVGRELRTTHPDGTVERRGLDGAELRSLLSDHFAIALTEEELALLATPTAS